jgi:putative transposase
MIEPKHPSLSLARQCRLVAIARSTFYYEACGESEENLDLMRRIDEQFLETPFYGSRQMKRWLHRQGVSVSRKRVRRLMRKIGLEALYQRPRTTCPIRKTGSTPTCCATGWSSGPMKPGALM